MFWYRDDGGFLVAGGNNCLAQGDVKYVRKYLSQLVCTLLKHTAGYVVWTSCFPWVDSPQGPVYIGWVQTENLVILVLGGFNGGCGVKCIKSSKVVVEVVEEVCVVVTL